jgi:hypothetical protein
MWDDFRDWWEWDSHFRQQIVLAVIIGCIGLAFTIARVKAEGVGHVEGKP